jgi:1-phosphofructokinase
MIATVTPNPAIEETVWLDALAAGGVNRVRAAQLDPAGKGINVSRIVHRLGHATVAFGFLAGEIGTLVERTLDEESVQHHFIRVPGLTPVNVRIVEAASGASTSFHGPGSLAAAADVQALLERVEVEPVERRGEAAAARA